MDLFALDKSWHGIHFLLTGSAEGVRPPVDFILMGGREIGDLDLGYGPARAFTSAETKQIAFDARDLSDWDSGLLTFLIKLLNYCESRQITRDCNGLPEGVRRLLELAFAAPERADIRKAKEQPSWLERLGLRSITLAKGEANALSFLGEVTLTFIKMLKGKAHFRSSDVALILQQCGPQALPILTLVSFLIGLILAYMGALSLKQFGASIYVADLVGLGMVREMGATMTGVLLAGRTGAAFAAQLGTMQVNEEIDAFRTLGIQPMEFLVLPRIIALALMTPLLTLFADFVGMIAGFIIGVWVFDLGVMEYYYQTQKSLTLTYFAAGMMKGEVFGILIAFAGCMRGMQCGRSASAVGEATTSAVVTSIVYMVIASAIMTIIYYKLGI